MSSPRPRTFSTRPRHREKKNAVRMQRQGKVSLPKVSPDKEPERKEVRLTDNSVSSILMVLIPAFKKLEIVIPARMIVVLELSAR